MNGPLIGVALGVAVAFLHGCAALSTVDYKPDANDKCIMQYVWDTTTVSAGKPIYLCPGWYRERRVLDAQPKREVKK